MSAAAAAAAAAAALIFLGITVLGWRFSSYRVFSDDRKAFDGVATSIEEAVISRLRLASATLRGLQGLYGASVLVERSEFRVYYDLINPTEEYPGAVAVSYFKRVPKEERERFIAAVRADTQTVPGGFPDFTIYPPAERGEYLVATYVEPPTGDNPRVMGFDVNSDPLRRSLVEAALDTGELAMTPPIKLLSTKKIGFGLFLPVYQNLPTPFLREDRHAAFGGLVSMSFDAEAFFSRAIGSFSAQKDVSVLIYDVTDTQELKSENLLYGSPKTTSKVGHRKTAVRDIAGRKLLFSFEAPYFSLTPHGRILPLAVLAGGIVFSVMLFMVLYTSASTRNRAVAIAKAATHDLMAQAEEVRQNNLKLDQLNKNLISEMLERKKGEEQLLERKAELEQSLKLMVGRELKMKELKDEIEKLKKKE